MVGTRFHEHGAAAGGEEAAEFRDGRLLVGDVVQRLVAEDAVEAAIRQVEPRAIGAEVAQLAVEPAVEAPVMRLRGGERGVGDSSRPSQATPQPKSSTRRPGARSAASSMAPRRVRFGPTLDSGAKGLRKDQCVSVRPAK
jgi:hypothetical protein